MGIRKMVTVLLNKVSDTSSNYETALEENQERLIVLKGNLQDEQVKLTEYHKMAILKDVSEEVYQEQKAVVDKIQLDMKSIQNESRLIEKYKTDDVDSIIAEINQAKPELNKKQHEEIRQVKSDIAEAKQEYLAKLSVIGKDYDKAVHEDKLFQSMLVRFGKQGSSYSPAKAEILHGLASVSNDEAISNL